MRYADFCGRRASVIALGTMDFGGRIAEGMARDFMDAYMDLGGNFIDTARMYGDYVKEIQGLSEAVIGRWMEDCRNRDAVVLSTKGGHPDVHQMRIGRLSREEVYADIRRSLDALRTDHVDIYWLHRDDPSRPVGDIMETLTELCERGMTRCAGVSNWTTARIVEAQDYAARHGLRPLAANQPQFSLARQAVVEDATLVQMDAAMARMHRQTGMPCVAFSAQAKGFLAKMDALGEAGLSDKARRRFHAPENLEALRRAQALARQTGLSVAALSLAWLTNQPFPTFPIVGMSRMEHVLALRAAGDVVLTAEQRDFLRKL